MIGFGILCIAVAFVYRAYYSFRIVPAVSEYHERQPELKNMEDVNDQWKDSRNAVAKWAEANPEEFKNYRFALGFSKMLIIVGSIVTIVGLVT